MVEVLSVTQVPRVKQVPPAKPPAALGAAVVNVGQPGTWGVDKAFKLKQLAVPIVAGVLRLDLAKANTVVVLLDQNVTSVVYENFPPAGQSVRLQVYLQQDSFGHRTIAGWPSSTRTAGGIPPDFSYEPGRRDSFVIDTFDGGETVHLNLVGLDYKPLT